MPRQTLTEQLNDTRRQLAQKQIEFDASRNTTAAVADEFERFKAKVREVALRAKDDQGWCDSGFNEAMRELGLDPLPTSFEVELTITATRKIKVTLDADNLETENRTADGARLYLDDFHTARDYLAEELEYGEWELTTSEAGTVTVNTD